MICSAVSRGLNYFLPKLEVLSNLLMFLTTRVLIDFVSFCIFANRNRMSLLILIRPVLIASFKTGFLLKVLVYSMVLSLGSRPLAR